MYEDRNIAFIDLLGFGGLVDRSAEETDLPQKILSALTSLQPKNIEEEAYASINYEICPPEDRAQEQRQEEGVRPIKSPSKPVEQGRRLQQSPRFFHSLEIGLHRAVKLLTA